MGWFDWITSTALLVVCVMWIIELWGMFSENRQDDRPMGERSCAKSDASGAFRPGARAMGSFAGSQAQNAAGKPVRHRAGVERYAGRKASGSQEVAKSLPVNGEGVSK